MTKFIYEKFNINKSNNRRVSEHTQDYIDIHCHCLPGIDDGPATQNDALALCRSLVDDGVTTVIATPHQLGQYDGCNEAPEIRKAVLSLNEELEKNHIPLTVMPGGDVRLDERICQLLKDDKIMTLADGGKYILLELPSEILIDIEPLIVELASLDVKVIVSHPERHFVLNRYYDVIPKWLRHSALLQITAGSLLGNFGPLAERAAWHYIKAGWVSLVATDSHNLRGRRPRMRDAFRNISLKMGQTTAHKLCNENPLRVLEGNNIVTALQNRYKELSNAES
jgi:protein-tyrosine phosphatase